MSHLYWYGGYIKKRNVCQRVEFIVAKEDAKLYKFVDYKLVEERKASSKGVWNDASKMIQEAGHWNDEADVALAFNGYLWSEITKQEFDEIYKAGTVEEKDLRMIYLQYLKEKIDGTRQTN